MESAERSNPASGGDRFAEYIRQLDAAAKAALRRSLSFPPGTWPGAFPYVEPWVVDAEPWVRRTTYLVAALQALSRASRESGDMGKAAAELQKSTGSASVEQRFLALLDADADELPHRLRQMITLMSSADIAPTWATLRKDLRWWRNESKSVQQRWAASYYRAAAANQPEGEMTTESN